MRPRPFARGEHGAPAALAVAVAAALTLAGLLNAPAATANGPDLAASTPVAKQGSELAAKRALSPASLRDRIASAMRSAGGASGAWVYDVDAGELLFSDSSAKRRIPASNQKLFTTAAFLHRFGAEGRLETRVYALGELRGARRAVLAGDLVIVGDGDPAFGTARFARRHNQPVTRVAALARRIAKAGIERITGRIRADDSIFDRKRRSGPWLSPLSGLSFNNGWDGARHAKAPELLAAKALKRALRKVGVRVAGRIGRAKLARKRLAGDPLATVRSPSAAKLVEETNTPSNNFFAEMLLKRIGALGGKGTRRRGARKVERVARALGTSARISDGSGLSRRNRVSPQEVGKLLVAMAKADDPEADAFRASLPLAGREGTLSDRMRGTAAEGRCEAKTGTLSGVSALSGYCRARGGRTIAFSVLMNSVDTSAARRAQDSIAAAIARYRP